MRPKKFSAIAAPTAAVPPPLTVPASELMFELSWASTSKELEATIDFVEITLALTVEVRLLVVTDPLIAFEPATLPAAAMDRIAPSMVAATSTSPLVLRNDELSLAVTLEAMSLTETAPPTALLPAPLNTPASESILEVWLASTCSVLPVAVCVTLDTSAVTSPAMTLRVTLPLMALLPDPLPATATLPMAPLSAASTLTETGAASVEFVSTARTLKSSLPSPIKLTATAPPIAPVPLPDTAPASELIVPLCAACTVNEVAVPPSVRPSTRALVLPLSQLTLDEPANA